MADTDFPVKDGLGATRQFLYDLIGGKLWSRIKIAHGPVGSAFEVTPTTPLPISAVDASGLPGVFVEASPDNAAYVVPAVGMVSTGGKLAFAAASAATPAGLAGTLVVLCSTQPCFVRQGSAPVAVVDSDTYLPANTRAPFIIGSGAKLAAIKPTGGTDGTLYYSVIG